MFNSTIRFIRENLQDDNPTGFRKYFYFLFDVFEEHLTLVKDYERSQNEIDHK